MEWAWLSTGKLQRRMRSFPEPLNLDLGQKSKLHAQPALPIAFEPLKLSPPLSLKRNPESRITAFELTLTCSVVFVQRSPDTRQIEL
jgi:hypothetical protein